MRRTRRRARRKKNTAALKMMVAILVIMLFAVGGMAAYAYYNFHNNLNNNQKMNAIVLSDKINKNVFINGVNVGGMTRDAAELLLKKEFIPELQSNTITVIAGEYKQVFTFGEFGARYDFSVAAEQAYQYGKSGSLKERYDLILSQNENPHYIEYDPIYTYDRSNISFLLEPLRDAVNIQPLNASITRKDGQFILSDSQIGRVLNTDATISLIVAVLDSAQSGEVTAVVDEVLPEYEVSDLAAVQTIIGTYKTKVSPGNSGRNQNIITALSKINDVVLQPGEVVSTNKHCGAMTYENGYREAPVIVGGQLESGMGGGVCQVSSTLYNAVLYAELEVIERMNHSLKVTYVDYGFDATLAGDYIDFKFKNNINSPVFIEALLVDGTDVLINIYGRETRPQSHSISFKNQLVATVQPELGPIERQDASLPLGQRIVKQKTTVGYRYSVYKTIYDNGIEVDRVLVNTSYYRPARGEVIVGTAIIDVDDSSQETIVSNELNDIDIDVFDPAPIQPDDTIEGLYPPIILNEPVAEPDHQDFHDSSSGYFETNENR